MDWITSFSCPLVYVRDIRSAKRPQYVVLLFMVACFYNARAFCPRMERNRNIQVLMAAQSSGKNPKKPPRFTQSVHKTKKPKINKDKMWRSGKSIEELEKSMTSRWGTSLDKWTAEDHFEDDDDDFIVVGEAAKFRADPVKDPWAETETEKMPQESSFFGGDLSDPSLKKVQRNQQRLKKDKGGEDADKPSTLSFNHIIASEPAGGRGTNEVVDENAFFFQPPQAEVSQTEKPNSETRRSTALPTQMSDQDGNPLYLTLKQAEKNFCDQVGNTEIMFDEETEAVNMRAADLPSWEQIGITNPVLLQNLQNMNCPSCLAVQEKACPLVMEGCDVLVGTYTGSGKTLAFLVPLVERILSNESEGSGLQALVIAPGRELASQIVTVARNLLEGTEHSAMLAIGGTTFSRNLEQIRKRKPSILIGTPGRIAELVVGRPGEKSGRLKVNGLSSLVLDEFDALLEYKPHREPTNAIIETLQRRFRDNLQSVLCSATASDMVKSPKIKRYLRPGFKEAMTDNDDILVTGNSEATRVSRTVLHGVVHVPHRRFALETLRRILHTDPLPRQILIFAGDSRKVDIVCEKLENMGIVAAALHGGMGSDKMDRAEVSKALREGYVGIVVATELAARGLDAPLLTHVINFDLPTDASHYAHRAGRCGRGGRPGVVINITVDPRERRVPHKFADRLGVDMQTVDVRNGKLNIVDPSSLTID